MTIPWNVRADVLPVAGLQSMKQARHSDLAGSWYRYPASIRTEAFAGWQEDLANKVSPLELPILGEGFKVKHALLLGGGLFLLMLLKKNKK